MTRVNKTKCVVVSLLALTMVVSAFVNICAVICN